MIVDGHVIYPCGKGLHVSVMAHDFLMKRKSHMMREADYISNVATRPPPCLIYITHDVEEYSFVKPCGLVEDDTRKNM